MPKLTVRCYITANCAGNSTDFRTSKIVIEARGLALISVLLRLAGGDGRGAHELYCNESLEG
jgi:hypothetical protein